VCQVLSSPSGKVTSRFFGARCCPGALWQTIAFGISIEQRMLASGIESK
jgi:hypothetical protein